LIATILVLTYRKGFFTLYRNLFTRLALEEAQHSDGVDDWPGFGDLTWPWAGLDKDDHRAARRFYNAWLSFSTEKAHESPNFVI
jgi:DnaJ homolog subfamily A member 5